MDAGDHRPSDHQVRDAGELVEQFRTSLFDDSVYVLTPQGRVIDLPQGKLLKVTTFAFYDLGPDDRFTRIRAASYCRRYEDFG